MELAIQNGDYCLDESGGLKQWSGAQEMMARVLFRLTARRGGLPFLPELGSQLHRLLREKPSARQAMARRYVVQALEEEPNLSVTSVSFVETEEGGIVEVGLDWQGEALSVMVDVT